jgi:hypothetical protein
MNPLIGLDPLSCFDAHLYVSAGALHSAERGTAAFAHHHSHRRTRATRAPRAREGAPQLCHSRDRLPSGPER